MKRSILEALSKPCFKTYKACGIFSIERRRQRLPGIMWMLATVFIITIVCLLYTAFITSKAFIYESTEIQDGPYSGALLFNTTSARAPILSSIGRFVTAYIYLRRKPIEKRLMLECAQELDGLTSKTCSEFPPRELEAIKLQEFNTISSMDAMKSQVSRQQFSYAPCKKRRYTTVNPARGCGFGCLLHWVAMGIVYTIKSERVLVLECPYVKEEYIWEKWFTPISNCQTYYWTWKVARLSASELVNTLEKVEKSVLKGATLSEEQTEFVVTEAEKSVLKNLRRYNGVRIGKQFPVDDNTPFFNWYNRATHAGKESFLNVYALLIDRLSKSDDSVLSYFKFNIDYETAHDLLLTNLDTHVLSGPDFPLNYVPPSIREYVNPQALTDSRAWMLGAGVSWLMDLKSKRVRDFIKERRERMDFTAPFLASIHVRRTDKYKEAPPRKLADYVAALEKLIAVSNKYEQAISPPYSVFIATDEPDVIKKELPASDKFKFYYDMESCTSGKYNRDAEGSVLLILYELEMLTESRFFVATGSSNIGRLVVESKSVTMLDPFLYYLSIDDLWHM